MLKQLWDQQHRLSEQFIDIEAANHCLFTDDLPVDLNDKGAQYQCKFKAWCYVEELAEAMNEETGCEKQREELADALHFFIELCLHCDLSAEEVERRLQLRHQMDPWTCLFGAHPMDGVFSFKRFRQNLINSIGHLGLAMNQLRNKPWKQAQIPFTKVEELHHHLVISLTFFGLAWQAAGGTAELLAEAYSAKHQVNQERIARRD